MPPAKTQVKIFQVDAFTDRIFAGNPAAVCPLDAWLPDETLQAIAAENNLAETAFFVREKDGYLLRWFTPTVEVELCGHATLASAFVVFEMLSPGTARVDFRTLKAGTLSVARQGERLAMDLPSRPPTPAAVVPALVAAMGKAPRTVLAARDHLLVYDTAAEVEALTPDFPALGKVECFAVIATAPGGSGVDFVSRFFAPAQGIPEDPVTGSAHCTLVPYWAERLGKSRLEARQVSARGGALTCVLDGPRVTLIGNATLYMSGEIAVAQPA